MPYWLMKAAVQNGEEMLSVCVRYLDGAVVTEKFLTTAQLSSTTAATVKEEIIKIRIIHKLESSKMIAAAFDGAPNFTGQKARVQTLLREHSPNMLYVYCRSHNLQLCLFKALATIPEIKQIVVTKLYSLFKGNPKRLNMLRNIGETIDKCSHKLVQPGETRWLSHEASISVINIMRLFACHWNGSIRIQAIILVMHGDYF